MQFALQLCLRKYLVIIPKKSKLKILHRFIFACLKRRLSRQAGKVLAKSPTAYEGISQDLENECPKLAKEFGHPTFQGRPQYTQIKITDAYLFIKIRHDILKQCHGNYIRVKSQIESYA